MKRILVSIALSACFCALSAQGAADSASVAESAEAAGLRENGRLTAEEADVLAQEGKYAEAIDAYEAILAEGEESAGLHYNLGYSYFKSGSLGKAIINFERAKRLDPSDADVEANLSQAYALTDKMEVVEPPFVDRMWTGITGIFGSDGWAWAFVVTFILALTGVAMFLFLDSVALRKVGFFASAAFVVIAVTSLCISVSKRSGIQNSDEAIVMTSSIDLNTSPDRNATRMTVLHEGTYVKIIDTLGDWIEVRLKDGNIGWIKSAEVEKI